MRGLGVPPESRAHPLIRPCGPPSPHGRRMNLPLPRGLRSRMRSEATVGVRGSNATLKLTTCRASCPPSPYRPPARHPWRAFAGAEVHWASSSIRLTLIRPSGTAAWLCVLLCRPTGRRHQELPSPMGRGAGGEGIGRRSLGSPLVGLLALQAPAARRATRRHAMLASVSARLTLRPHPAPSHQSAA